MATLTHLAERTKKEKADVIRDALKHYENSLNEWVSRQNIPPPD